MSTRLRVSILIPLVLFLGWRMVRPLNIFTVDDKFAWPIATAIPAGLGTLRASECGQCHREIFAEWSESMHAKAWTDEYFVIDRAFEGKPPVCDNCHIQLERQREQRVLGFADQDRLHPTGEPNPDFDPLLRDEGVTCAVCHVRDGTIIAPHVVEQAPHPTKHDPDFLAGTSPCKICHVVGGKRWDMFYDKPPCGTLSEIKEGGTPADCVGCHLPAVVRPVAEGSPPRAGGRHLFQGGHFPAMVKSALTVRHARQAVEQGTRFDITLENSGAGHYLPTGTPDRHLTVEWRLLDGAGLPLREKIHTLKRTILWRPFIVDLWDSRLPPATPRSFSFLIDKKEASQATTLEVVVRYHLLEESRRKRIGYDNPTLLNYPVSEKRYLLHQKE